MCSVEKPSFDIRDATGPDSLGEFAGEVLSERVRKAGAPTADFLAYPVHVPFMPLRNGAEAMPNPGKHPKPAGNLLFAAWAMRYRHPAYSGCAVVHRAHTPGGDPQTIGQNVYCW